MKNVIIKGIPAQQNESYADIVKIAENVVVQLGVADETNQIVTVRRLRSSNDNKPLIVNFTSSRIALMILKAAKTKKLPGIQVKQDLPYNVRIARRNLSPFFTEAINQAPKEILLSLACWTGGFVFFIILVLVMVICQQLRMRNKGEGLWGKQLQRQDATKRKSQEEDRVVPAIRIISPETTVPHTETEFHSTKTNNNLL